MDGKKMEEASGCWPRPLSNRAENSSVTPHITRLTSPPPRASSKKFPLLRLISTFLLSSSPPFLFHTFSPPVRHELVDFTPRYTTLSTLLPIQSFRLSGALRERGGEKNHVFGFFLLSFFSLFFFLA